MTSLLSPTTRRGSRERTDADVRRDLSTRRPLVPTATLGGALAAGGPLLVALAVAVVGWFLTDGGGEGTPGGSLRVGSLFWLAAHGSGVTADGVRLTAIPLGLTLLCAWSAWRIGHRVGEAVSGHGPDADRIADGERDWTVPLTALLFTTGYVVVAVIVAAMASTPATQPSTPRVVAFAVLVSGGAGFPAIARGSGRAAIWVPTMSSSVRAGAVTARRILLVWTALSAAVLLVAFALDFSTAANVVEQLHADAGDTALITLLTVLVLPNALLFTGSYLLGPGFAVGSGTVVSPAQVVLGPLPMFPLLAALPDAGPTPGWAILAMASPVLVAGVVAALAQRSRPVRWDQAALRGCGGGLVAGVLVGAVTLFAGGAVGPGRMRDVGPSAFDVLLHAVTGFGVGGLLGALAMVGWQQRGDLVGRMVPARFRRG
jgi:hypothetical protein